MLKISSLSNILLDSFQAPQTRESVESSKNGLEYESFEYESRLDPSLVMIELELGMGSKNFMRVRVEFEFLGCEFESSRV